MARPKVGEERREEILKAFEACVLRRGFWETTLDDVANESGLPRPLVRYFIGNRDDMVTCLIERIIARCEAQANILLSQNASPAITEITDLLFDQIFTVNTPNIVMLELWHLAMRDEALRMRLAAIYHRLVSEMSTRIKGEVTCNDAKRTFDVAFSAAALALGASLFEYFGLTANDMSRIRSHATTIMEGVDVEVNISSSKK